MCDWFNRTSGMQQIGGLNEAYISYMEAAGHVWCSASFETQGVVHEVWSDRSFPSH